MINAGSALACDELEGTGTYTVNVYGRNANLISEYSMQPEEDISSIEEAEIRARENLESCNFADVIVVVTEEKKQDFKQVQIKVQRSQSDAARKSKLEGIA